MPAIGPTPGQARILKDDCGVNPESFKNTPQGDIIAFIRHHKQTPRGGNPEAASETFRRKRKDRIREKQLVVGVAVDVVRRGVRVVQSRPIAEISDDGYVRLEDLRQWFPPQQIEPTSEGAASLQ